MRMAAEQENSYRSDASRNEPIVREKLHIICARNKNVKAHSPRLTNAFTY